MTKPSSAGQNATRQCWECLKRRLECDRTLPHCKKCQKADKECPGYDEQKPLQWVVPRKMTTRRRKQPSLPKSQPTMKPTIMSREIGSICSENERVAVALHSPSMRSPMRELAWRIKDLCGEGNLTNKNQSQSVVTQGLNYIFVKLLKGGEDERAILTRIFEYLERENIPRYDLLNETSDVVQAVHYYNTYVHPQAVPASELAHVPTSMVYFPVASLHILPPAIHSIMVCWCLNHRINALPPRESRELAKEKWSKVYDYRGAAIRQLSESISKEKIRCSDGTIAGIFMFLCLELHMSISINWRVHSDGLLRVINLRGGLMALFSSTPHLRPTLAIFNWIAVYGNTMSSANDQIVLAPSLDQQLSDVTEMYEVIFPFISSPPIFLLETIRINHLRTRGSVSLEESIDDTIFSETNEILARIETFDGETWAQANQPEFHHEWALIGKIFQAAVAIYSIMSLQSIGILPNNPHYVQRRAAHGDRLFEGLKSGLISPRLKNFMIWPLVVAGVEAGYRTPHARNWVEGQLVELMRALGTSSPLKARNLLRRYWARKERGWDECFDGPYSFVL